MSDNHKVIQEQKVAFDAIIANQHILLKKAISDYLSLSSDPADWWKE